MANRQTGSSGSAVVSADGRHVDFTVLKMATRIIRATQEQFLGSGPDAEQGEQTANA